MNENIRDFFNQVAVNYNHQDSKLIDELLDSLFITKCKRVLDLGCGKGIISEKLAMRNDGEVVALDLSSEMLKYAKEKINDKRVKFVNADFYQYEDQPFDAIVCFDAYPHFLDEEGFAEKA
ncbi:MAG: class I SAM-dependent methyltransferase, partial [Bacilli bacterium]|nr:class I SAM-dependent methyltransferase [Bacilli bacterium]